MQEYKWQAATTAQVGIFAPATPCIMQTMIHVDAQQITPIHEAQPEAVRFDDSRQIAVIKQRTAQIRSSIATYEVVDLATNEDILPVGNSHRTVGVVDLLRRILHTDA